MPKLAQAIARALREPEAMNETARLLRARVQTSFSVETMIDGVLDGYAQVLARQPASRRAGLAHV